MSRFVCELERRRFSQITEEAFVARAWCYHTTPIMMQPYDFEHKTHNQF